MVVCPFSVDHCIVCPSLIYGFLLPLWYLQTFLKGNLTEVENTSNETDDILTFVAVSKIEVGVKM
jgi:hypothetical protein